MNHSWLLRQRPLAGVLFAASAVCGLCVPAGAGGPPAGAPTGVVAPPIANVKPFTVESPHGNRVDDYYWLRDDTRQNPEVLAYLDAENAYADAMLAHVAPLKQRLYDEIVGRIEQDDDFGALRDNGCWYYRRFEAGQEYPVYARRKGVDDGTRAGPARRQRAGRRPRVLPGARARGLRRTTPRSPGPRTRRPAAAHAPVQETSSTAGRSRTASPTSKRTSHGRPTAGPCFYIEKDPVTLLGLRVRRHVLGTDPALDPVVYEEDDHSFYTSVCKTKRRPLRRHLRREHGVVARCAFADAADPRVALPGVPAARARPRVPGRPPGRTLRRAHQLAGQELPADGGEPAAPTSDRSNVARGRAAPGRRVRRELRGVHGLPRRSASARAACASMRVRPSDGRPGLVHRPPTSRPTRLALGDNPEQSTRDAASATPTSLRTPLSTFDFNVRTGERTLLKQPAGAGRLRRGAATPPSSSAATARDGKQVPVSLVYRKGTRRDGTAPLLQYAYGSYGSSTDPWFQVDALSLLDRGFVFAIAHVRGGQEMGRALVRGRQAAARRRTPSPTSSMSRAISWRERYVDPRPGVRERRQRRRPAHGRDRQPWRREIYRGYRRRTCRSSTWSPRCSTRPSR